MALTPPHPLTSSVDTNAFLSSSCKHMYYVHMFLKRKRPKMDDITEKK